MTTLQCWWDVVDDNIDALCGCADLWGGRHATQYHLRRHAEARDYFALCSVLHAIWFGAPDHRSVYTVEGFNTLCDLLDGTIPPPTEKV
jgi:hypothetical protein